MPQLLPHLTPHNIAPELLDLVMSFVPDADIPACVCVNTVFYASAKPQLFRDVALDSFFYLRGPEHPLVDLDAPSGRPLFRRSWMRFTHTLDVRQHHESLCCDVRKACHPFAHEGHHSNSAPLTPSNIAEGSTFGPAQPILPVMPSLRTLRVPFDVHGNLATDDPPAACGLHALRPRHLVHLALSLNGAQPTTSTFERDSLSSYTAFLSPREMDFAPLRGPSRGPPPYPIEALRHASVVTLVCPPACSFAPLQPGALMHWVPECLAHPAAELRDYIRECPNPHCVRNLFVKLGVATTLCRAMRTRRVQLVGFEALGEAAPTWMGAHVGFITRALMAKRVQMTREKGDLRAVIHEKCCKPEAGDIFRLVETRKWIHSAAGQAVMTRLDRKRMAMRK